MSPQGQKNFNEELDKFITADDDLIGTFKYNRRSNYKPGIVNTLGVFDEPSFFRLLHTLVNKDLAFWFTCAHEPGARTQLN